LTSTLPSLGRIRICDGAFSKRPRVPACPRHDRNSRGTKLLSRYGRRSNGRNGEAPLAEAIKQIKLRAITARASGCVRADQTDRDKGCSQNGRQTCQRDIRVSCRALSTLYEQAGASRVLKRSGNPLPSSIHARSSASIRYLSPTFRLREISNFPISRKIGDSADIKR